VVCGGAGHIQAFMFMNSTSYCFSFWITRVKGDDGEDIDIGVDFGETKQGSAFQVFFPKLGLQYPLPAVTGLPCLAPPTSTYSYAGRLGIFPICTGIGYVANPNLSALVWDGVSVNSCGSIITVNIFGNPHSFMITNVLSGTVNGGSGTKLAVRYE
jgi:hypothetical protein